MDPSLHSLTQLFAQLGLPDDAASIDAFIAKHAPLPGHVALSDAGFWNAAQSAFLFSELANDADWAGVVDSLNLALHVS